MRSRIAQLLRILIVLVVFAAVFSAYDLYSRRPTHLRQFNRDEVTRLDRRPLDAKT